MQKKLRNPLCLQRGYPESQRSIDQMEIARKMRCKHYKPVNDFSVRQAYPGLLLFK